MMDGEAYIIAEPERFTLGIIEETPMETPEEVAPPDCKVITVTKGGEKFQFCVPEVRE
jgi:hypothetical protein